MKKLYLLVTFSILIILSSCGFEMKNDEAGSVKFDKSELYGQWVKESTVEDSENRLVNKINLKDDLTAEIQIIGSNGVRAVSGTWKINDGQKIGSENFNISSDSGIMLKFWEDDSNLRILMLEVKKLNKKKILTCNEEIFEKE